MMAQTWASPCHLPNFKKANLDRFRLLPRWQNSKSTRDCPISGKAESMIRFNASLGMPATSGLTFVDLYVCKDIGCGLCFRTSAYIVSYHREYQERGSYLACKPQRRATRRLELVSNEVAHKERRLTCRVG